MVGVILLFDLINESYGRPPGSLERVIHAVLTSRIILNLRGLCIQSWDEDHDVAPGYSLEIMHRSYRTGTSDTYASSVL